MDKRVTGAVGSVSGAASILGSWQVCHNVCLGIIALLSVMGITLTGMPLAFLVTIAVPVWVGAVILFGVVAYFYFAKKCVSKNLLLFNAGLIIAGTPFQVILPIQQVFWGAGGTVALFGIAGFVSDKLNKNKEKCCK